MKVHPATNPLILFVYSQFDNPTQSNFSIDSQKIICAHLWFSNSPKTTKLTVV